MMEKTNLKGDIKSKVKKSSLNSKGSELKVNLKSLETKPKYADL